jgi:hypothetical protein
MENGLRLQCSSAAGNKAWAKGGPRDYFCLPVLSQNLKLRKVVVGKSKLKVGMDGNGSLSRPKFTRAVAPKKKILSQKAEILYFNIFNILLYLQSDSKVSIYRV